VGLALWGGGGAGPRPHDWGDAYASLSAAAEVFRDAAARGPGSPRTLGNWGNALLQLGRVRDPAVTRCNKLSNSVRQFGTKLYRPTSSCMQACLSRTHCHMLARVFINDVRQ
jgi:hypothetical protein